MYKWLFILDRFWSDESNKYNIYLNIFATRLIINKIIKVQWVDFMLENVLVSLHSLKPMGLGSIIFKEWRVTQTFSYT